MGKISKGATSIGYKRNRQSRKIYEVFELGDGDIIQIKDMQGYISPKFRRCDVILTFEELDTPTTLGIEFNKYLKGQEYEDEPNESLAYKVMKRSFYGASFQLLSILKEATAKMTPEKGATFIMDLTKEASFFWNNEANGN